MKHLYMKMVVVLVTLFFLVGNIIGQDEAHYYTITTWKMTIPEDGNNKELNELLKEWHDKIIVKNDKILSEKVLRHSSGSDSRDWVIITEYASWNDIDAANEAQGKLIDEGWPNKDDRQKYFKTFGKYGVKHTDEILRERPKLSK